MQKTLKFLTIILLTAPIFPITFALMVIPQNKSCFREWFPEGESVAITIEVEAQSNLGETGRLPQNQNPQNQIPNNPIKPGSIKDNYQNIHHHFFDSENNKIGELLPSKKDTFTYVTHKPDIISICVDNYGHFPILVHYVISMNVYNNDHSRVATKDHLKMYEEDVAELERVTLEMKGENRVIQEIMEKRLQGIGNVSGLASRFAGFAVVFIFVVKVCEILFLRRRLMAKKII